MARYDVGSYNQTVHIDFDKILDKHDDFIRNSRKLEKLILIAISNALDDIALQAEKFIKKKMMEYGLLQSDLYKNLTIERVKEGLYITTYAQNDWGFDYAMYVEFGTGIVGSGSPHPKAGLENWQYDVNSHGVDGWWYPSHPDDPNPTKYQTKDGSWKAWTAGQVSRPFMYDTWKYISSMWNNVMNKHINRAKREWGDGF